MLLHNIPQHKERRALRHFAFLPTVLTGGNTIWWERYTTVQEYTRWSTSPGGFWYTVERHRGWPQVNPHTAHYE